MSWILKHIWFLQDCFESKNGISKLLVETIWLNINWDYGRAGTYDELLFSLKSRKPRLYQDLTDVLIAEKKKVLLENWDIDYHKIMRYLNLKRNKTENMIMMNWKLVNEEMDFLNNYISENKLRNLVGSLGNMHDALIATRKQ